MHDAYCENGDCRVVLYTTSGTVSLKGATEDVKPLQNCPGCGRMGRLKDKPTKEQS